MSKPSKELVEKFLTESELQGLRLEMAKLEDFARSLATCMYHQNMDMSLFKEKDKSGIISDIIHLHYGEYFENIKFKNHVRGVGVAIKIHNQKDKNIKEFEKIKKKYCN